MRHERAAGRRRTRSWPLANRHGRDASAASPYSCGVCRCRNCARTRSSAAGSSSPPTGPSGRSRPRPSRIARRHGFCPFCEGSEDKTPHEILAYRDRDTRPNEKGWRVRVVPNKFPALQIEGDLQQARRRHLRQDERHRRPRGHHRVPVPRNHAWPTSREENIREVLWVYRDRLVDLKKDPRLVYGMVFKNVGAAAGASLEHSHSQLIVTPIVPINVWEEMTGALEFFNYRGRCIYCDMIHQELAAEKRIVLDTPNFVGFCPVRQPLSRSRRGSCRRTTTAITRTSRRTRSTSWARCSRRSCCKLEAALDKPAYNYIIHTVAVRHAGAAALPLAHRDHPAADARGRLRVGHRLLHQPGAAGAGGRVTCDAASTWMLTAKRAE